MDKQDKESWCQYAKRKDYYRESQWDGRWIRMNKREILEYEEELQQRERRRKDLKKLQEEWIATGKNIDEFCEHTALRGLLGCPVESI